MGGAVIDLDKLETTIADHVDLNPSGGEVPLSVGESILLALEAVEKAGADEATIKQLQILYLEGIRSKQDKAIVSKITACLKVKKYDVKSGPKAVNDDPVRRYFETRLAFNVLQKSATALDYKELSAYVKNLKKRLFSFPEAKNEKYRQKIHEVLEGTINPKTQSKYEMEYAELIHRLLVNDFYGLPEDVCKNLCQIARATILATINTQVDQSMPINIYNDSIFTMGMDGRGRIVKKDNDFVRTTTKGLMRASSPLPMYDDPVNPVEQDYYYRKDRPIFSPFQRSADQSGFMVESEWTQQLFARKVHPYSNGISSTTLATLRNVILEKRLAHPHFGKRFEAFITSFAALMLYNSGGHSFFEIVEVLKLPQLKELCGKNSGLEDALAENRLMDKIFREDQAEAFEEALKATQVYRRTLLNKRRVHAELAKQEVNKKGAIQSKAKRLQKALIQNNTINFEACLKTIKKSEIDMPLRGNWTALMVASQLGKTHYVAKLIEAGANISHRVDGLSSLDLAIKSGKYETVKFLLNKGAVVVVKPNENIHIRKRAPALYIACYQTDVRILQRVLMKAGKELTQADLKDAMLVSLRAENLAAMSTVLEYAADQKIQFPNHFKDKLLTEAVRSGNEQLLDSLIKMKIFTDYKNISYDSLLYLAAYNGFLPAAKQLLTHHQEKHGKDYKNVYNKALLGALEANHFGLAVLFIVYGADPNSIPATCHSLKKFNDYLENNSENCLSLFGTEEVALLSKRVSEINQSLNKRESGLLHSVLKFLTKLLNMLLPNQYQIYYNEKTSVMRNSALLFTQIKTPPLQPAADDRQDRQPVPTA